MAVSWSDTMANAIINAIIRQVTFPLPAACYAGLCTTAAEPTATSLGSAVEANFTGYGRAWLTNAIMSAPTGSARQTVSSGGALSFGTPTAALDTPSTLGWLVLFSASSGGTYLGYGPLTAPVQEVIGSALTISTNNLTIRQT